MYTEEEVQELWQQVLEAALRDGAAYSVWRKAYADGDEETMKIAGKLLDEVRDDDWPIKHFYTALCGMAAKECCSLVGIEY